jgi:hypothetical protein
MSRSARVSAANKSIGLIAVAALLAGGCSDLFGPDTPVELLSEQYLFGPCGGGWSPTVPPVQRTVLDVRVNDDGRATGPSPAHVRVVRSTGGRILHRFNVGMLRAEMDVEDVPRLFERGTGEYAVANYVATVSDLSRRDVTLIVLLSRDLTDADIEAVESLGARVQSRLDALEGYIIDIDDAAIPQVRALPGVQTVGANSYLCLASRSPSQAEVVQRL